MQNKLRPSHRSGYLRQYAALASVLCFLGCFAFIMISHASNNLSWAGDNARGQKEGKYGRKDKCPSCAPSGDQVIYIPLTDLPEAQAGELVFNSRTVKETNVTPTFYKLDGTEVVGAPVTVQPNEIRYVDFKTLLPAGRRGEHDWGGMTLSFYGVPREIWAQYRLLGINGGASADEFFTVKDEQRSDIQEAVWWAPRKSVSIIALGNITDAPTGAVLNFGDGDVQTINLAPHATEVIRRKRKGADGPESVTVNVQGMPGSVIPTGVIASGAASFNSVVRFYDTKKAKQPRLFGNGFRLTGVAPHMVLKNTSSFHVTAQPKFIRQAGMTADPFVLPEITLGPHEAAEVDLGPLVRAVKSSHDLDVTSVQVSNSGEPGSLIGSLYGIDETGTAYDTPLRDSGPVRSMTGAYPWKVTKDFTTIVYITNISDQEAEFVTDIHYDGGKLVIDPRKLQPGETAVLDLQKIRDEQIDDNKGRRMPKDKTIGQFAWAVRGTTGGKIVLIGRAEMVSRTRKISSSYSCPMDCGPTYEGWVNAPGLLDVSQSEAADAWEQVSYNWGYTMGPYAVGASWSLDNAIASLSPTSGHETDVTGTTPGDATLDGFIGWNEEYVWDGLECVDRGMFREGGGGPVTVRPVVRVTAADIALNTITISLEPATATGQLRVFLNGPGGQVELVNRSQQGGETAAPFNTASLPAQEFTSIGATWTVNNLAGNGSLNYHMVVLGDWLQTCYNTPLETDFGGGIANAGTVRIESNTCMWSSLTFKTNFLDEVNENGSGVDSVGTPIQIEGFCGGAPATSPAYNGRRYRRPADVRTSCNTNLQVDHTVARAPGSALSCGTPVFIEGFGRRFVEDSGGGLAADQLDNYKGVGAAVCQGWSNPRRKTVKLF